jgi:hypothetical protein
MYTVQIPSDSQFYKLKLVCSRHVRCWVRKSDLITKQISQYRLLTREEYFKLFRQVKGP